MSSTPIKTSYFSPDIAEFLKCLHQFDVQYLIVGGEAVIFYGHARYTGDVDFFYADDDNNASALFQALSAFWDGDIPEIFQPGDLQAEDQIIQFGRPPHRIDLLNRIDGVSFEEAWPSRVGVQLDLAGSSIPVHYLSLKSLIQNKEATGRPKDLDDLNYLKSLDSGSADH